MDERISAAFSGNLQQIASAGLGTIHRGLAHGADCHLCASEHQDEGRLVGSTGGHQEHL